MGKLHPEGEAGRGIGERGACSPGVWLPESDRLSPHPASGLPERHGRVSVLIRPLVRLKAWRTSRSLMQW